MNKLPILRIIKSCISGITLTELIVAVSLLSVVAWATIAFDEYYRKQEKVEETRIMAIREPALVIDHMTRRLTLVMGSDLLGGIIMDNSAGLVRIKARIDRNNNGVIDNADDGPPGPGRWIAYQYNQGTHTVSFNPDINSGGGWGGGTWQDLSSKITAYSITKQDNFFDVRITGRNDPVPAQATRDNPDLTLQTRIYMPGYSY